MKLQPVSFENSNSLVSSRAYYSIRRGDGMFREMRRDKQLLSKEESDEILHAHTCGVLGVTGDDGYPYAVPISYVYKDNKLYFHSAYDGHKMDGIRRNDKVSFCVIDKDEIHPEKLTSFFRSVIVFGRARILTEDNEKRLALEYLVEKHAPDFMEDGKKSIERDWNRVCMVEINIEHITGKEAIELVNKE
jgi:uncharacterized protein